MGELRARLQDRQIVDVVEIVDEAGLEVALRNLIGQHNAGEPVLPIDLVVALLLMRKLDKEHRWTGNAKGYMWADDLPNGKGVDIQYKPRLGLVIKVLTEAEYLTFKISNGSKKYALNPVHREAIYEILRTRRFPRDVHNKLVRNGGSVSARELDLLNEYDGDVR